MTFEEAVQAGDWETATALVADGADPDPMEPPGQYGRTLLQRKAMEGDAAAVERLLELGADVDRPYFTGASIIDAALSSQTYEVVQTLLRCGATLPATGFEDGSLVHTMVRRRWLDLLDDLLARGLSADARERNTSYTPMELACWLGHTEVVAHLLEKGVSAAPSPHGHISPLALAERGEYADIVRLLVKHGVERTHPGCQPVCPDTPDDWNDAAGWDAYWRHQLLKLRVEPADDGESLEIIRWDGASMWIGFSKRVFTPLDDRRILWRLRHLPANGRVLLVGNGVSLLPRAVAHTGRHAVAIDLSRVATDMMPQLEMSGPALEYWFQNRPGDRLLNELAAKDGSATFVCGDVRDMMSAPGPFDLIANHKSLQGLPAEDRAAVIHAMDERLSPKGVVSLSATNAEHVLDEARALFTDHGYTVDPDSEDTVEGKLLHTSLTTG